MLHGFLLLKVERSKGNIISEFLKILFIVPVSARFKENNPLHVPLSTRFKFISLYGKRWTI